MVIDFTKKRGLLYLANFFNYDSKEADMYCYCESEEDLLPLDAVQIRGLGLSKNLTLKRNNWLEQGTLFKNSTQFFKEAKNEITSSRHKLQELDRIENRLQEGEKVVLFSFIDEIKFSHISIIGEYFKEKGYRVKIIDSASHVKAL